jgi:hypothetical protein
MSQISRRSLAASALVFALNLAGCADQSLNGGYTGEEATRSHQFANVAKPEAASQFSYPYRGGRDPTTGLATQHN